MDKELTPKQQTSEAIRQSESILIMTGQHPTVDQVAAVVALGQILRKHGKKTTTVISEDIPAGAKILPTEQIDRDLGGLRDFIMRVDLSRAEVDKLKYTVENGKLNVQITPFSGGFHQRDVSFDHGEYHYDLVIVLGVASYSRIDKIYTQNAEQLRSTPLVNIDFHRINEQYGAVNLVENTAASLAEILMALSESLQAGLIDSDIATTMLTGLMAATDRFTNAHTTAKTMTVAAQMMAVGADQQKIVKSLYRSDRSERDRRPGHGQSQSQSQARSQSHSQQPSRPVGQPIEQSTSESLRAQMQVVKQQLESQSKAQVESNPRPAPVPEIKPEPPVQPSFDEPDLPQAHVAQLAPVELSNSADDDLEPPVMPMPTAKIAAVSAPEPASGAEPQSDGEPMEELLPPQHIEMSEPEPLINDTTPPKPVAQNAPAKAPNPINNPKFAQSLDEFEI